MKKLIPLLLSGAMLLSLAACGSGSGDGGDPQQSGDPQGGGSGGGSDYKIAVLLPGSPTDGGYCQQGADGVRAIQAKYGLDDSQVAIIDSVTTADAAKAEAEEMAAEGYTVIFGQGGQFAEYFKEVAQDYPDTWFVTNGGAITGDNQFPMCMSTEQGGYVCGVLGALMSQTGTLGTVVSGDYPSFTKPSVGYSVGAKSVNPNAVVKFAVLSASNSNEAYETLKNQIQSGADFFFPNADEGNSGAIKAIAESDAAYGVGVFGDYISGAPERVAGNMVVDAPGAYVAVFDAIVNGEAKGEIMFLGMAEGVISFQWNEELKATLPEDVVSQVDQAVEDIKAGKIDIPNEYDIGETGIDQYFN
ncbi:BMP family ABC transporter substrate-binding protein [Pseudoflavonifractor sp. 524-17]|uniref:BMP family lipoprotein n=1 Tax=Pseudoflavonifractor sp. 524-17 TaxID=2304577 RepID=UPI001379E753|nr:BMP family ABC transporter substrate-binding protein [Pseudoflavonifractor sp. 524-17]NCE63114.1 BMP family ABC transporter substrate-binding protein [Pseudoflavonifractor sp. 524-17]